MHKGDRQLGQKWRRTLALLVYLLFAAPHLTTRCISVGVHLLTLLPDRVEAALLVRGHTLPTRPFYSTSYLPVRALEGDHVEDWVDALEWRAMHPSPFDRPGHLAWLALLLLVHGTITPS